MSSDRLSDVGIFVAVVDEGGFTAASRKLGVSKSHVSKRVAALEDRLGVRLLHRTTRKMNVTEAGAAFFARCARVLEELDAAERALADMQEEPRGTLRVTAPMSFGVRYLAPAVADFMLEHSYLNVDVNFSDRTVDLVDEGFDLAVRIGSLADSSLVGRRLARTEMIMAAAPDFIARIGVPTHPGQLDAGHLLHYHYRRGGNTWAFTGPGGEEATVRTGGRLAANNGDALVQAAIRGVGVVIVPDFLVCDALCDGSLVRILPEWTEPTAAVWALYPHSRHLSPKVRVFVDFLAERFGGDPPWRRGAGPA